MAPAPRPLAAKALREAHMNKVKSDQSHKWVPKLQAIVVESSSDSGEDSEARFSFHSHQSSISTNPGSEVPDNQLQSAIEAAAVQDQYVDQQQEVAQQDVALKNTPENTTENTPEVQQTTGVERSDLSTKKKGKNKINADQAHRSRAPPGLEKESIDESDVLKDGQLAGRMLLSFLKSPDASCAPSRPEPQPLSTDEYCLWAMQAREDKEMGADELNEDTFGANAGGGWSFEENLAANQVLANQGLCAQQRIDMLKKTLKEIANFISIEPWCLKESVRYVLTDGWKHITWRNDYTGLHLAAEFGEARVLPLLISLGADPTAKDSKGRTPSDIAAAMQQWSCVSMLETVQQVHEYERTAAATLTQAPWEIEEQRLCRAICQAGCFLDIQPAALREAVKHTIAIRYSPAISDPWQFSPALHMAAELGRSDVIPMLLALRIDPKEVDASGRTAIDVACDNGHWDCFCAMACGPSKKAQSGEAAGRDAAAKHELLRSQAHEPLRLRALPGPR